MVLIVSKFIVSMLIGFFAGLISVKEGNELTAIWLMAWWCTIVAAIVAAIMFVFGDQSLWTHLTVKEWLGVVLFSSYLIGGVLTYWLENRRA